jgi:hypothetical protein
MKYRQNINPVYAIGAVALIGGLMGSFLWGKAENLGTEFDLESRLSAAEGTTHKDTNQNKSTRGTTATASNITTYDTDGALLIRYTNAGFSPASIQTHLRQVIRFRNDSDGALRVAPSVSASDAEHYYSNLEQGSTVAKGGSFDFGIGRVGVFPYTNLNNLNHTGLLVVTP